MATVYKAFVGENLGRDGLSYWMMSGEEVAFDGRTAVKTSSTIISDDRETWHETRETAQAAAADKILAVAERLTQQAARVRQGGDR